ncbi:hypothetical protein ACQP2X_22875 [Actinoplanes sp. CA-131856]
MRIPTLIAVAVVTAALFGVSQWDSSADDDVQSPASSWKAPDGYTVRSTVDVSQGSIRLWVRDQSAGLCYIQEEVDAQGRHQSAASGSCWNATDTEWRSDRGMETLVFAPPRKEGASVVLTAPDGSRLGPFPVIGGLVMIHDDWLHEPVRLGIRALDASGKALEPAGALNLE